MITSLLPTAFLPFSGLTALWAGSHGCMWCSPPSFLCALFGHLRTHKCPSFDRRLTCKTENHRLSLKKRKLFSPQTFSPEN
ncbi:hypothetical protein CEXT_241131 [Caerostris extrusa]|uniref:Secreted protein n=1 Tax=Caerostris extrusa TaxID=172846 RepID=A0AAV4N8N6_CAEEX|nr:hypothetical protein CEXT_241131 [Caerostris extrusa]